LGHGHVVLGQQRRLVKVVRCGNDKILKNIGFEVCRDVQLWFVVAAVDPDRRCFDIHFRLGAEFSSSDFIL
jgi:hypothetical protein